MSTSAYFIQIGIIIFPICVYQIWIFGKSFNQLPLRTSLLGLYGGIAAVFCQQNPVPIFGHPENFQCVPIVLAFLYGRRRAGLSAVLLLCGYQALIHEPNLVASFIAIALYSLVPFLICNRFTRLPFKRRMWAGVMLSFVTLAMEWLFIIVYLVIVGGTHGQAVLTAYAPMLGVASVVQCAIMTMAFFLLENILQNGRIRNRYESLVRYNPLAMCAVDTEGRFTAVNSAYEQLTGYTEAELLGQPRVNLRFPEDIHIALETVRQLQGKDVHADLEIALRHKDGRRIEARSTLVPIVEGEERVGFYAMVNDITEQKVAEELLLNSEKLAAVGELAAGVAHEIRNPLTALKGFLQLIPEADDPARYIQIMQTELVRIEAIVSELLVLAKPQAAEFAKVDLRQVVAEVLPLVQAQADMKSLVLVPHFFHGDLYIEGISNQLKQVFLNIIKNAIEAVDSGGRIDVYLEPAKEGGYLSATVRDNGAGIPEDVLKRMGEPFFTTKSTGTGLGVLVCQRIIINHAGTLEFCSEVGWGTVVEILLPLAQ